ncbi:hypothetical protein AYO20_08410 [Fonsecaea nubica]|uniref:Uncharacterized protein n=1 Tax=Fonsecaea nubica TaxID=856822 RepID=A0A178CMP4_9EURO|nr:hypothetical protein AYO20_08410 [Fonsecaea nubica]OAL31079.1 hypothetical protein AYO20_08410 [Fonsecaea nubica]
MFSDERSFDAVQPSCDALMRNTNTTSQPTAKPRHRYGRRGRSTRPQGAAGIMPARRTSSGVVITRPGDDSVPCSPIKWRFTQVPKSTPPPRRKATGMDRAGAVVSPYAHPVITGPRGPTSPRKNRSSRVEDWSLDTPRVKNLNSDPEGSLNPTR